MSEYAPSAKFFCHSYLDRYDENGGLRCPCGKEHRLQTRRILLGDRVMEQLPGLLAERQGSGAKIWILSDENTEAAAGQRCKQLLSGFSPAGVVLPASPRPRTTVELINSLSKQAGEDTPDLILAVGSGTISDIAKMVSRNLDVPNWCVPTAPSVDAYSSGTSALKLQHQHRTEPARPTEIILADLDVLEKAPRLLFLSGVGDLLAKYLSYLDWRLSALITGEYICEQTAELCLESARQALGAVKELSGDRRAAVRSLTDAVLVSGLAMQALVNSRPASSAEHTIAHYWELAHAVGNPALELHGLLVGMSSRIVLPLYKEFYGDAAVWDFDPEDRLRSLAAEPDWEQALTPEVQPFHQQMREEMAGRRETPELYRSRLEKIREHRRMITELASGLLGELEQAVAILADIEYPFHLSDYRLDRRQAVVPFRYVRFLRSRYNSFDLIHELGADERMFGLLDQQIRMIS
jgi:glycerol-1-phosphate dehydrogenase [NAD(P)+]